MSDHPDMASSSAVGIWASHEVSARRRAWITLGLLAAIGGGLGSGAVAGARRTATAYVRFREATGRSDAIAFATQLGVFNADYSAVRRLPEVDDAGEFALAPIGIKEFPGIGTLAPNDDHLYQTINRPLLVAGRLPDPNRTDEVLVNRAAAAQFHISVGRRVTVISSNNLEAFFSSGVMKGGPTVAATVVGIGDSNVDLVFTATEPSFIPSAAFLSRYKQVPRAGNLIVRLKPGTDVVTFRAHAAAAMHLPNLPVRDQAEDSKRITHGTDLERIALLLFAAAVALASLVLVGQAVTRSVYASAASVPTLRAIGYTRAQLVTALALPILMSAAIGSVLSVAIGIAISPRFPVGLAARVEPSPGFHVDALVLSVGALAVALVLIVSAAYAALRATNKDRAMASLRIEAPFMRTLRSRMPVSAAVGGRLATQRGRGERSLPIRPAIAATTAAVVGVIAAFGLLHGINDALQKPDRSGQVWDVNIFPPDGKTTADVEGTIRNDPDLAVIATQRRVDLDVNGQGIPVYALDALKGLHSYPILQGRAPATSDEAALGPATARALRVKIGDPIRIAGHDVRVVGLTLLMQTPHSSFDQGASVTFAALHQISPKSNDPGDSTVVVRFASGISKTRAMDDLMKLLGRSPDAETATLPQDVLFLQNVRTLPKILAGFLVLLGFAAVAHVLVSTLRRRRFDLAILRALGFRPRQTAACVLWQANTVGFIALVVGIPLGIAAGRWSWRAVADSTPLLYVAPIAVLVAVLSVPSAIVALNAIAAIPARRAARLQPAEILRAE